METVFTIWNSSKQLAETSHGWMEEYGTDTRYGKLVVALGLSILLYLVIKGTQSVLWVIFYILVIYLFYLAATMPLRQSREGFSLF